jgi:hypothetical protein
VRLREADGKVSSTIIQEFHLALDFAEAGLALEQHQQAGDQPMSQDEVASCLKALAAMNDLGIDAAGLAYASSVALRAFRTVLPDLAPPASEPN